LLIWQFLRAYLLKHLQTCPLEEASHRKNFMAAEAASGDLLLLFCGPQVVSSQVKWSVCSLTPQLRLDGHLVNSLLILSSHESRKSHVLMWSLLSKDPPQSYLSFVIVSCSSLKSSMNSLLFIQKRIKKWRISFLKLLELPS
jgi:hypothetical protein